MATKKNFWKFFREQKNDTQEPVWGCIFGVDGLNRLYRARFRSRRAPTSTQKELAMSTFSCPIVEISVTPHNNADRLEVAHVLGYSCVVGKGQYHSGDKAAYIPEASIVPDDVLQKLGLEGMLAGAQKNRVKAVTLRGVLSQGILYPAPNGVVTRPDGETKQFGTGEDASEFLGVKKYEPEVPLGMSGDVVHLGADKLLHYDIENIQLHPDVFEEGEPVVVTEKIHGTFCGVGIMPFENEELIHGRIAVFSKGVGKLGNAFKNIERNENNLYMKLVRRYKLDEILMNRFSKSDKPVFIMGEIFGKGVQDLNYDQSGAEFRAFDCAVRKNGELEYIKSSLVSDFIGADIPMVPRLYEGPFYRPIIEGIVSGRETISSGVHMREGVVIRPFEERYVPGLGRAILKWVSKEYLLRHGGTEFN